MNVICKVLFHESTSLLQVNTRVKETDAWAGWRTLLLARENARGDIINSQTLSALCTSGLRFDPKLSFLPNCSLWIPFEN